MSRAMIIGAGGVAGVVINKCCQNSDVFTEIMIASRTKAKCDHKDGHHNRPGGRGQR